MELAPGTARSPLYLHTEMQRLRGLRFLTTRKPLNPAMLNAGFSLESQYSLFGLSWLELGFLLLGSERWG